MTRAASAPSASVPACDVEALRDMLQGPMPPLVLDVREPREHAICALPGARLIPLGNLPEHMDGLPRDRTIVVHCHHGGRSARAVALLQEAGFKAVNLTGGIHAWATHVDPSMTTY